MWREDGRRTWEKGSWRGESGGFVPWRREWETFSGLMVRKMGVLIRMSTERSILLNCDFWNDCWEQMWILILIFPLIHHPYLLECKNENRRCWFTGLLHGDTWEMGHQGSEPYQSSEKHLWISNPSQKFQEVVQTPRGYRITVMNIND